MPYFFASSVDSTISSAVIFLSMLSRIAASRDSTPRLSRWQPARRISRRSGSVSRSTRVSQLQKNCELALADPAAELEHALLVGGEGVVLDLDHLHGEARDRALDARRARSAPTARGSRGPTSSRRRRRCRPTGSRATSSRCACRSSRAARRACRGPRSTARSGPSRCSSAVAVDRAGDALRRLALLRGASTSSRKVSVALAERDRVDLRVVREHLRRERRRVRAADDDVRLRVVLAGSTLGDERDAAAVRRPARHAVEVGVERRDDLLDLATTGTPRGSGPSPGARRGSPGRRARRGRTGVW